MRYKFLFTFYWHDHDEFPILCFMLKLESETAGTISDPTDGDISQALSQLDGDGNSFAILKRSDTDYIQAAGMRSRA